MVQFVSYLFMPGIPVKTLSAERAAVLPGRGSHSNEAVKHCSTVLMYSSWTIIRSKYFTNLLTSCDVDAPSGDAWVSHLEREMRLCSTMSAGATWRQESCEIHDVWDKEVWDVCVCELQQKHCWMCAKCVRVCYCIWQRMAVFPFIQ